MTLGRVALMVIAAAGACRKTRAPAQEEAEALVAPAAPVDGRRYLPLRDGNRFTYRSTLSISDGPADVETRTFVAHWDDEFAGEDRYLLDEPGKGLLTNHPIQYVVSSRGVETKSGLLGATKTEFDPPLLELPASLAAGEEWMWQGRSGEVTMRMLSRFRGLEQVTVPAGTFECARIDRTLPDAPGGAPTSYWYADGVGVVKVAGSRPRAGMMPKVKLSLELVSYEVKPPR